MTEHDYVVLRRTRTEASETRNFGPGARWVGGDASELEVHVTSMTDAAARDALRDPATEGIARSMPTRLIAPLPSSTTLTGGTPDQGPGWGVAAVGATESPYTGQGVTAAVIDTGVDVAHAAFHGVHVETCDFTGTGDHDANGHGTHCAGILLGRAVEGVEIGVATGAHRLLAGKVLDNTGTGTTAMLIDGLNWAFRNEADIVSVSIGFDFAGLSAQLHADGLPVDIATSKALVAYGENLRIFDALMTANRSQRAIGRETLVVAASGNESRRSESPTYDIAASVPAAAEGVVSVGAAGPGAPHFAVAPFSNSGCLLTAPGIDITSAKTGGGLIAKSGTSMACPHVAGVAALWLEKLRLQHPQVNAADVIARLISSSTREAFSPTTDQNLIGSGLVAAPRD